MIEFKPLPELSKLQEFFSYDPDEGILRWRVQRGPRGKVGSRVGWKKATGYYVVEFEGTNYYVHRLIWKLSTGDSLDGIEIDHINGDPSDNRIINLRLADRFGNSRNTKLKRNNTSGFKGVYWNTAAKAWQAYITLNGKSKYLGIFPTPEKASEFVREYREQLHGQFTNHG